MRLGTIVLLLAVTLASFGAYAQRVPVADSTDNATIYDVIGNKTDAQTATVGTTASLVAYMKGLLNAGGATAATATGTKADAATTTVGTTATLVSYIKGIIGVIGASVDAATTDSLHGKIGTDTEMADSSLFDMLTAGAFGTVNATTTDGLHGKIGTDTEMGDASLFDMLTSQNTLFGTNASATTDSLLGRIGTDTEMGDVSLYDMLTAAAFGTVNATTTDGINGKIGTDTEMADSSLFDMLTAQNTIAGGIDAATTDSINGKIGTDTEMADSSLFDLLTAWFGDIDATTTDSINGKIGTDTEMADTSLYDMLVSAGSAIVGVSGQLLAKTSAGVADIDVSESDYTGYVTLLTIVPATGGASEVCLDFDWNKATSGWDTLSTAADTLDVIVQEKIDGTNYRTIAKGTQVTATGAGTLEESINGQHFDLGMCAVAATFVVKVKLSVERADIEIPYRVTYLANSAATITPVAAGV